jgi:DNA-binding NtrC family response regulator
MNTGKVLVVDDNKKILDALRLLLKYHYEQVMTCNNPERIPELLGKEIFDVILLDMNFKAGINSGNEGLFWLKEINRKQQGASVVMITAYGDINLAVKAIKEGAFDFVLKPWENEKLLATIEAAFRFNISRQELSKLKGKESFLISEINKPGQNLVGSSEAIQQVLEMAEKVAGTDANVLITGENGTGKELLAREIHRMSTRAQEVLVTVDVGAIPETLFESELFGHEKGAFTDAKEMRKGRFELADEGTLFLDEIGNLNLPMQAKLLNALQNRQITRIGGNQPISVNIRLICATNTDLEYSIQGGSFREDLFYRINTIVLEMPPLRERKGDVEELANYFLEIYSRKYERKSLHISPSAVMKLNAYSWPGNVRELQHVVERAVIMSNNVIMKSEDFLLEQKNWKKMQPSTLEEMERTMIEASLERNQGNLTKAASQLGITRQTLYNKIKRYQ